MVRLFLAAGIFLMATVAYGQTYNHDKVCGTDTIHVNYRNLKTGERISYQAFECVQVVKTGLRVNIGFSTYSYSGGTKSWLGRHSAGVLGLALVQGKFNFGVNFKLTTVNPQSKLALNGDTITPEARLNPIKGDFFAGYSIDLKKNFSFEPHLGITRNLFYVINEKELNKTYDIPKLHGFNAGLTLNKYFKLEDFQFLSLFVTYNYGFTNFRKLNPALGSGYSEWSFGLSYKVFAKKRFHERIN